PVVLSHTPHHSPSLLFLSLRLRRPPTSTLFPYTTLFRSLTIDTGEAKALTEPKWKISQAVWHPSGTGLVLSATDHPESDQNTERDRKSTRLNSSHVAISYAVFCLKKKTKRNRASVTIKRD